MNDYMNIVLLYLVIAMPFLYFLYFVIKKAIKDGLSEYYSEHRNNKK